MNEDIKTDLDAELPPGRVPFSLDTDKAVALGRRTRKRRTLITGGGSVLSAVAVVALVVGFLTPGGSSDKDERNIGNDKPTSEQQKLPDIDPDEEYGWGSDIQNQIPPVIKSYTDAFWKHMRDNYPELSLRDYFSGGEVSGGTSEEGAYFGEEELSMNAGDMMDDSGELPPQPDFDRLVYSLVQPGTSEQTGESMGELSVKFDEDAKGIDIFDVMVFQPGSFKKDSGDALDLATCNNDSSHTVPDSCEAETVEGPGGADLRHVTMKTRDDGEKPVVADRTVVLYRDDGSAVVVNDEAEMRLKPSDPGPQLSFDQLAAIALALPDTPVK